MAHSNMFPTSLKKKIDVNYKNEVCEAFELARKHGLPAKIIEVKREGPIHEATFTFEITVGDFTAQAQGPSITIAKNRSAEKILPVLLSLPLPSEEEQYNY
uniref:DRBM domain-containing protein n=1 Tax=Periophthalmus magnuspinnatus TaxID=409849 RepID=A0A3B3ZC94_9GOBI